MLNKKCVYTYYNYGSCISHAYFALLSIQTYVCNIIVAQVKHKWYFANFFECSIVVSDFSWHVIL